MERKLIRGDYVPDGRGGLIGLDGGQEVLARVLYRPCCLSKNLGASDFFISRT